MRLFVAIELDDDARGAVAAEQKRLKSAFGDRAGSALRWIRPEHMHLTLAFLGELDDSRSHTVVEAIRQPIQGGRFSIVFGGLGVFPSGGAPRVLWLGLVSGAREVGNVQHQVAERLAPLGTAPEPRPFHPHLTLARWRTSGQPDRRRALAADGGRDVARLDVETVALIQSRLSSAGPIYVTLCEGRLGDSAAPPLQSD